MLDSITTVLFSKSDAKTTEDVSSKLALTVLLMCRGDVERIVSEMFVDIISVGNMFVVIEVANIDTVSKISVTMDSEAKMSDVIRNDDISIVGSTVVCSKMVPFIEISDIDENTVCDSTEIIDCSGIKEKFAVVDKIVEIIGVEKFGDIDENISMVLVVSFS